MPVLPLAPAAPSPVAIARAVGRNAANRRADVLVVQTRLNLHLRARGLTRPLVLDGDCGPRTLAAIRRFQSEVAGFRRPDGIVDPYGRTHRALIAAPQPPAGGADRTAPGQSGSAPSPPRAPTRVSASTASASAVPAPVMRGFSYATGPQARLADIAVPYVGATEGRNNRMGSDPRMREIFEADWIDESDQTGGTDGYPWCCAFVSMCVQKLIDADGRNFGHLSRPRTAGVTGFRTRWAPRNDCLIFPPSSDAAAPHRGDVVVYTFSHIGIVNAVNDGGITAIEGNTSVSGSREGTTVRDDQNRAFSIIRCFIRFPMRAGTET